MALELGRRRSSEGLNDYNEHLGEETNERTWDSLKKTSPFDLDAANRRKIEESKRQTLERLEGITGATDSNEEKARQDVINSYRRKEPQETSLDQFDYGKTGVGSFSELMTQRGKEQAEKQAETQMLDRVAFAEDWISKLDNSEITANLLSEDYYDNFLGNGIAYQGLPAKIQGRIHEKNAGFIGAVVKPIAQHERINLEDAQDVRNGVRKLQEYSSSCHDSVSLIAKLQKNSVPIQIKDSERLAKGTEGFAKQIAHLNFEDYIEDGSFKFNFGAFFSKNDQDISTVDILAQTGNIDGLTVLYSLGHLMRQNRLFQPRTEQVQHWDGESHRYREKESRINTSQEGNELIDGLKSTVLYSLDIVDDENFNKLMGFVEEKLEDETDILEFADAANRITDANRREKIEKIISQKIEKNGHSMRQDGKIDVIRYYYPSLDFQQQ